MATATTTLSNNRYPLKTIRPTYSVMLMFLVFFCGAAHAQEPSFIHLTVKEGLPAQTVYHVLQDKSGYIWMATENGLTRYDGHRFQTWTKNEGLPDNEVLVLREDDKGRIWAGTMRDYVFIEDGKLYDRKSAPWIPKLPGLPWSLVQLDNGKMCFASRYGTLQFDEHSVDTIYWGESHPRFRMIVDRGDASPISIQYDGIVVTESFYGSPVPEIKEYTGLPRCWGHLGDGTFPGKMNMSTMASLRRDSAYLDDIYFRIKKFCNNCIVHEMQAEDDGLVWAATGGSGVLVYNPATQDILHLLKQSTVHGIKTDRGGNKWIYTMSEGVFMLPFGRLDVLNYHAGEGLLNNPVVSLEAGREGKLFLGYDHGQIGVKAPDQAFVHHIRTEGIDVMKKVREMKELSDGSLLCIGDQGLFVVEKPGEMAGGGTEFDGRFSRSYVPGAYPFLYESAIKGVTVIHDTLWYISSSEGILRCAGGKDNFSKTSGKPTRSYSIEAIPGTEELWISTLDSVLICDRGVNCRPAPMGNGLRSRVSEVALAEDGKVWVATLGDGLFCLDGTDVLHFTTSNGLPSNVCNTLFPVAGGKLWIGSDHGVSRMRLEGRVASVESFTMEQGLAGNYVNDVVQIGEEVWVATQEGLSVFNPDRPHHVIPLPQIAFSVVNIRGRDTLVRDSYVLEEWQNSLEISFRDSVFQAVRYQYRLLEKGDTWVNLPSPKVDFSLLEAGKQYHLEVRAINRAGQWSASRRMMFDIRLPYYKRTWFALLITLLIAGIPALIFRVRRRNADLVRRQREEFNRQLAQSRLVALKSQMNPHFLFNSLNSIQHLITENDARTTSKYVAKFSRLMRRVLDNSHSEFISLTEEISVCKLYMELEAMRLMHNFSHEIYIDPDLEPDALRVPGMMLQPFIENAIWHGLMPKKQDRQLKVELRAAGKQLRCIIEDNGVGRQGNLQPESGREGHLSRAVNNFEERLALFNRAFGKDAFLLKFVDLQDAAGQPTGTRVEIVCPVLRDLDVKSNSTYA